MDIKELTRLIIGKLKNGYFYSEITDDKLNSILIKYLELQYSIEFEKAAGALEKDNSGLNDITDQEYTKSINTVENRVINIAQKLAAINKEDLKNLI